MTKFTFDLCLRSNFINAKTVQNHLVYHLRDKCNQQKPRSVCERNCKIQRINKKQRKSPQMRLPQNFLPLNSVVDTFLWTYHNLQIVE